MNRKKDFWNNIKHVNIHITGVVEGEGKKKEAENLFEEIIVENFSNPRKDIDI